MYTLETPKKGDQISIAYACLTNTSLSHRYHQRFSVLEDKKKIVETNSLMIGGGGIQMKRYKFTSR